MSDDKVRVAVLGAGKFGTYHASKYAALDNAELIAIVDQCLESATRLARRFGCQAVTRLEDVIDNIDAATIATPATTHARLAIALLAAGKHVYIEKPLATNIEDAQRILLAGRMTKAKVQCGFQERYILSRLHLDRDVSPQRIECRRRSPWTGRGADVDVALDLMIHDVDMVLQLAGPDVRSISAHGDDDELSAVVQAGGCTAHLHASRRATHTERTMLLVYEDGTVYIDFLKGKIHDSRPITIKSKFGDLLQGANGTKYDPLGLAISEFIRCVQTGTEPTVTGECGLKALAVISGLRSRSALPASMQADQSKAIPLFDVKTSNDRHRSDINARIATVLDHGQYIGGPEVTELEHKLAEFCGARYCMTVSSGTTALSIALMGEGLTRDDAVFVPALTYNATCNAVITAGATPVIVDVDRHSCNISAKTVRAAIEAVERDGKLRPAVICAVDLYGKPAPYTELAEIASQYGMVVLADAAQSFGATQHDRRVGNLAHMTATSFYPSKTLGGLGDGGAIFTNDAARYQIWQSIRWHGTDDQKRESVRVGLNGRMSTMQCAMLLCKFKSLEEEINQRKHVAEQYLVRLSGSVMTQQQRRDELNANGLFTIMLSSSQERATIMQALKVQAIGCGIYYPLPLHRHRAFRGFVLSGQAFPNAEWLSDRVLSLPMGPFMTSSQIERVCTALLEALTQASCQGEVAARL